MGLGTSMGWLSPVTLLFRLRDEYQGMRPLVIASEPAAPRAGALVSVRLWVIPLLSDAGSAHESVRG